jgi:hypothetical protein
MIAVVMLIFPLFTIGSYLTRQSIANREAQKTAVPSSVQLDKSAPDVYYIILDAYGRQDVLQKKLGYDNTPFLHSLRERGFFVADCSQSNYGYTEYSLASSLNYDYLDALGGVDNNARIALIKHGAVRSFFESLGYQIIAFPTGWSSTEWKDADIFYDYGGGFATLTEFEKLFLDTTLLRVESDYSRSSVKDADKRDARRLRIFSALDKLKQIPDKPEHTFTFAHLVIPHNPYSFGPNGEFVSFNDGAPFDERAKAYSNQVTFINREILKVVDVILQKSEVPPVIIIQGDHGPAIETPTRRMPILNVYYLPGGGEAALYPSITPVNSFRVVFDRYFGAAFELLPDTSYYSSYQLPYAFAAVPDNRPGCR